jgi:hypothetical protein
MNRAINSILLTCDFTKLPDEIYEFVKNSNFDKYRYEIQEISFEDKIIDKPILTNDWKNNNYAKLTLIFQLDSNCNVKIYANNVNVSNQKGLLTVFPSIYFYSASGNLVIGSGIGKTKFS